MSRLLTPTSLSWASSYCARRFKSAIRLAVGHDVKKSIGTVNTAEFLVTLAETTTFVVLIRDFTSYWQTILGLIIGGVCAAPLAAWICKKIPVRPLLAIVGILIIALNLYSLLHYLAIF